MGFGVGFSSFRRSVGVSSARRARGAMMFLTSSSGVFSFRPK